MPIPIIGLDTCVRQFAESLRECFSKPQFKYFVTVLMGLLLCQEPHTLSGLLRQIMEGPSLSGLSRFFSEAPWEVEVVVATWFKRFREQMQPRVAAEQERQRELRPKRRGRPKIPVVTGYLIGDDSTIQKRKGQRMQGLGKHHSTTEGKRVRGHSLVQSMYVLLGRRCPLAPQLYRQQSVCKREGVPFRSKIELMIECICTFEPVEGTLTHVLLDSWYSAKAIWRVARERGFLITTGLKSNRSIRVDDPASPAGWRWQELAEYAAGLPTEAYALVTWPTQTTRRQVYVHVISTRVRKLYSCQVVIVRESLDAPLSEARYFASSDLQADTDTLLQHITARWDIEVLFGDTKDLLGLDQYQLMSATAILRFWTLVMATYTFLDEQRDCLRQQEQRPVTIGEARRQMQRLHRRHLLHWLYEQFQAGFTPEALYDQLAA
jgi:DDE superfamily endonuclease